jgi:hypothetical protein
MTDVKRVGDAYAWVEQQSSIHVKACSANGDPLEFTAEEARAFGRVLMSLAAELEALDSQE